MDVRIAWYICMMWVCRGSRLPHSHSLGSPEETSERSLSSTLPTKRQGQHLLPFMSVRPQLHSQEPNRRPTRRGAAAQQTGGRPPGQAAHILAVMQLASFPVSFRIYLAHIKLQPVRCQCRLRQSSPSQVYWLPPWRQLHSSSGRAPAVLPLASREWPGGAHPLVSRQPYHHNHGSPLATQPRPLALHHHPCTCRCRLPDRKDWAAPSHLLRIDPKRKRLRGPPRRCLPPHADSPGSLLQGNKPTPKLLLMLHLRGLGQDRVSANRKGWSRMRRPPQKQRAGH